VLFAAVVAAYQPVWFAGFIWDDDQYITANPVIVGPLGLKEIWTTSAADICPLTLSTFWVEHAWWGSDPLLYHLVNVFLHGGCAVVLWRVLRALLVPGAWAGAALWALHPVQVESVAWITEMKNTESGLFFLLSILFFARDGGSRAGRNYFLVLLFAALAMTSKSSTVVLPLVLCLCAWWQEGRWRWSTLGRVAPVFFMSMLAGACSMWTQGRQLASAAGPQWERSWPERLATAGDAVWFYLGKLLWPQPLITIYPRWKIDAGLRVSYLPLVAVIAVLFVLWLNRGSWARAWFFSFACFLAALLPVLGLAELYFNRYSFVADHFQYLADMGPMALAGAGLAGLADRIAPGRAWLAPSLGAGLALILGMASWNRAWVYEDRETLWTDTVAKNPDCWIGYNNLGAVLLQKGDLDGAIADYEKALAVNPDLADPHYNIGIALSHEGRLDEAMGEFEQALKIDPHDAQAHSNLGLALARKGRLDEAAVQFENAVALDSGLAEPVNNLGWIYLQEGRWDAAISQFRRALQIDPALAEAHYNLGAALLRSGQTDAAIAQFQETLRLQPGHRAAQDDLAKAETMGGHPAVSK
jgi:tetratricopeptide (TPR) repeat protein